MNQYLLPSLEVWQCRPDALVGDYFCHNIVLCNLDKEIVEQDIVGQANFAILGFQSDLGVRRNLGRIGAKSGPTVIRQFLSRLSIPSPKKCYDCGDVVVDSDESNSCDNLLLAQQMLAKYITRILQHQRALHTVPIILGGGHETAYGHYLGLLDAIEDDDIAILNFDAHFDLRPLSHNNQGNSGTPFRQIYNECVSKGRSFNYYCVGIQPRSNTCALYEFARQTNTTFIEAAEVKQNPHKVLELMQTIMHKHKYIYLSICLDVFHYSVAPGVSAPQALGIYPEIVIDAIKFIRDKVLSLDIVELNPELDIDNHTARLAANLVAEFCY